MGPADGPASQHRDLHRYRSEAACGCPGGIASSVQLKGAHHVTIYLGAAIRLALVLIGLPLIAVFADFVTAGELATRLSRKYAANPTPPPA
jgi:hypothetical protein